MKCKRLFYIVNINFINSVSDVIRQVLEDMNIKEKIFNLEDIRTKIDEVGPYQNVFLQECEYMNYLLYEIIRYIS